MIKIIENTLKVLDGSEKKRFAILVVLDILISFADILSLAVLLWIVQFYIQPVQTNTLSFLPSWLMNRDSVMLIAVFVVCFAIKNLLAFFISKAFYTFSSKAAIRISYNNLLSYQHSSFENFIHTDSSAHIRNICFQPYEYCQYMLSGIQQIITQVSLILIAVVAILLFNAKLFLLLLLILLPPVTIVFYFIKKRLSASKKHIRDNNERSFQYLLDALKGYVEANIYNRNDFFLQRFINSRKKFSHYLFDTMAIQILPNRIIEVFAVLGLFILIAIAQWTGNNDSTTLITIGAFIAAAYKIIPGLVKIINVTGQMKAYEFSVNELQQNTAQVISNDAPHSSAPISSLALSGVHFKYATHEVLHNFSLTLSKGDFMAIRGRSGLGKTTIMNLVLGFLSPQQGHLLINGLPVDNDRVKSFWHEVAYVRQQPFIIHDTLLRNITLQEEGYDEKKLEEALRMSGLDEWIEKNGGGLEMMINENGKNISGGQQQRIAIARALYKDATLILLDEPLNELDKASADTLLQHFATLAQSGKMILMITHDTSSLAYCNKIVSLDEN